MHRPRILDLVIALPLGLLGAAIALRWADLGGWVPMAQSAFPGIGIGCAVGLAVMLALRRWWLSAVAGLLVLALVVLAVPTLVPRTVAPSTDDLVVMSANLEYGGADAEAVVRQVRDHHATVLVLIEVTPQAVKALRAAGLDDLLPHAAGRPRGDAGAPSSAAAWRCVSWTTVERRPRTPMTCPSTSRSYGCGPRTETSCSGRRTPTRHGLRQLIAGGPGWRLWSSGGARSRRTSLWC